jgi:putative aldouronate transport system permease protein
MAIKDTSIQSRIFSAVNMIFMVLVMAVTLYPLLYTIAISFSDVNAVTTNSVKLLPKGFNLKAYQYAMEQSIFWISYRNTIIYTVFGTAINLIMTLTLAYAISRRELLFRKTITLIIIATLYFQGGVIARFIVYKELGLYNNIWAVVLPFAITTYNLVVVRTYMQGIPEEILESVRMDGGNDLQIFARIVLPLSKPVIATIGLFYAVSHWNSYFWPMVLLRDKELQPLQVLLRDMITENNQIGSGMLQTDLMYQPSAEMMIAASIVIALIPILCVYPFIQRYFVKGAMVGALKG